jgi:hypothetical protein
MLVLFVALFDIRPLWAHEGHTHVMGIVAAVSDNQLVVSNTRGQTVAIQLDRNTRYRANGMAASRATVRVGERITTRKEDA